MTFPALLDFAFVVLLETTRAQRDAVVQLHVRTDPAGFANHHAGPVIDKKMTADLRPRMNVDSCPAMSPFRHDSRNEGQPILVKDVGQSLDRDRFDTGITNNDLVITRARRVSLISGFDVALQNLPDRLEFSDQVQDDLLGPQAGALRFI